MQLSTEAVASVDAVTLAATSAIADAQAAVIFRSRQLARDIARNTARVERESGLVEVSADERRARSAARSLARQWHDMKDDPSVDDAAASLASSIDRTSSTEVFDAMNAETRRIAEDAIAAGAQLTLIWWALADACEDCSSRHGETVPAEVGFDEWPPLHSRCRCHVLTEQA